ncbi:hypothetical protein [Streptomyces sp. NPDC046909]|uniref:hypothetical protein n=1 Tax=Streptomyces sp. NPDC046909 TaxID=3155617 RepID=UPI0033E93026
MRKKITMFAAAIGIAAGAVLGATASAQAATYYNSLSDCQAALKYQSDSWATCTQTWGGAPAGKWVITSNTSNG